MKAISIMFYLIYFIINLILILLPLSNAFVPLLVTQKLSILNLTLLTTKLIHKNSLNLLSRNFMFIRNSQSNDNIILDNIIDNVVNDNNINNISNVNPIIKERIKIVLNENDLEEKFVRATGNGGQKVNKSSSKVVLIHKPTGLKTTCQDARDLSTNRSRARKLMIDKLDLYYNMELSKIAKKQELTRSRKKNSIRKSKKKYGNNTSTINNDITTTDEDSDSDDDDDDDEDDMILSEKELELIRLRTNMKS